MPSVTVKDVVKVYKKSGGFWPFNRKAAAENKDVRALDGVSFEVQSGEFFGLLGPNGAGKTTVFYMITGLVPADSGRITIDGRDVTSLPMYRRARLGIGYLPQEASIFRGLSVEQTIDANRREFERAAEILGVAELVDGLEDSAMDDLLLQGPE